MDKLRNLGFGHTAFIPANKKHRVECRENDLAGGALSMDLMVPGQDKSLSKNESSFFTTKLTKNTIDFFVCLRGWKNGRNTCKLFWDGL